MKNQLIRLPLRLILVSAMTLACTVLLAAPEPGPPSKDVNVVNTPDVNVVNTPDVSVANTPDVNVANTPGFVFNAQLTRGQILAPPAGFNVDLVTLSGPGVFISALVVKRGGDLDTTSIELEIDGEIVISRSILALRNWGLTEMNAFGTVLLSSNSHDNVSIGFPFPLAFQNSLILRADNAAPLSPDTGVLEINGLVVHGKQEDHTSVDLTAGIGGAGCCSSVWAVRSGDVAVIPVPAAVWLFGSALGLLGWMRRKKAS